MIDSPVLDEPRGQRGDAAFVAELDQVQAELAEICGLANATAGRLCEVMAGLLRSGGWNQAGVRSPEHYLVWKCALSKGDAHRVVRVARRIGAYPACAAAFAAGELSLEQAHIVCSCGPPTWADEATCRFAKVMTIHQLRTTLGKYNFTEPGSPEAHEQREAAERAAASERRRLSMGFTDAGAGRINAELPADEYAVVRQGLAGCRDDLFHERYGGGDGEDAGGHDPSDVSWIDALVEMANRSLAHGAARHPHADRNKILWHHSVDPAGRPVLHAHQGAQVPEWMRRFLLCEATVAPVAHLEPGGEGDLGLLAGLLGGTPVNQGREKRIVPDRLRRLVEQRDGGCRVPGCDARNWLKMHHVVWWENGGTTDSWNVAAVCGPDHRAIHRGELIVTGNADLPPGHPDGLVFTDANGRTLTGAARAAPPHAPPVETARHLGIQPGVWRHPLGEALRYRDVYFNGAPRPG